MPTPTVPYKMLAKGYRVSGNFREGYSAKVGFLVSWADAFNFADQVMGRIVRPAGSTGLISYYVPWLYPGAQGGAKLYADDFDIEPVGQNGQTLPTNYGMAPGEFFTHALVTVTFKTPTFNWNGMDYGDNQQQLDPANPITLCEQSIKIGGRMSTRPGSGYVYSDLKACVGDIAVPEKDVQLVLKFPRVPYLPWSKMQNYVGTLNDRSLLNCPKGTLLLEGADTQLTQTSMGVTGQMMVFEFNWRKVDWNKFIRKDDGTYDWVYSRAHESVEAGLMFPYTNLADVFVGYQELS